MRLLEASLLLLSTVSLSGCAVSLSSEPRASRLSTGFWFWNGSAAEVPWSGAPIDALFVHAGALRQRDSSYWPPRPPDANAPWLVDSSFPNELPPAREYWFVFRYDRQAVPSLDAVRTLSNEVAHLQTLARKQHLNVAGVQLDIDSPTGALAQYAAFLHAFRKEQSPDLQLSITALLDWFRSGTAVGKVIAETDEFVPQFYDLRDPGDSGEGTAIAARINPARWGPVFNRFRKRFRIGISTFGRARMVPHESPAGRNLGLAAYYSDVAPIDLATNPAFAARAERNEANELVLTYRAMRKVRVGYSRFDVGDAVQFILPTPEAIRAATESARQMGGYLAGVVFFRWPASDETLAMQPEEVLLAAGLPAGERRPARVDTIDGDCAAVACVDLYLESGEPFSPQAGKYRIDSSADLEYFLPEQNMPIRMSGPSQLELSLPPYCARGRLYLGRAVTATPSRFTVEEQ